ncbi:hypothetical protein [Streptomyces chartreusis]|uniref:hypothetical protein n=1 Tax=Streptomyces chartreusis TaxID=1969 RepID=UPI003625BD0A
MTECLVWVRRDTGRCAGYLELDYDRGDIGGFLAPDHRGQGLDAGLFLPGVELAHGHAGLPTVRAGAAAANPACRRALERAASSRPSARPATPCRTVVNWTASGTAGGRRVGVGEALRQEWSGGGVSPPPRNSATLIVGKTISGEGAFV